MLRSGLLTPKLAPTGGFIQGPDLRSARVGWSVRLWRKPITKVMQNESAIRLLEKDSNRRGDLFGRLMADLFVALGYELPRLNVHKSGRELDLEAMHRLEPRRAIAECKATADTIGGDDINKFVGAID